MPLRPALGAQGCSVDRMRAAPAAIQAEYDAIRRARPGRLAWLASPRLYVMPARFMRAFGGAAVMYRWTCIGPQVLHAPAPVRRALLAHEWGHVVRGHSLAAIASLVLLAAYIASPWPPVSIALLAALAAPTLWITRPARELEADDEAVALVGAAELAAAIRWAMARHEPGKRSALLAQRLARLDQLSGCRASA